MNVPNWFPVWFSSSRVPITSMPTFRRWAVAPGNHENSSASSRLPVLVCWGSPLLPPNASATRVSPPVGRAEPTSTYPDGSLRNAVASRRWRATYPRSSLMKCPPKNEVSEAITPPPRVVRVPPVAGRARLPTRVGSWDSQLPSSRRVRVWTSLACQSSRSRPSVLFVARSPERPESVTGAPVALARVTQRVGERALRNIGAAARRRRDEAARELTAGHVVGVRDDPERADGVLGYAPRAKRHAVHGDVVRGGSLPGDREGGRRRVAAADPQHAGLERRDGVHVGDVDRQPRQLLGIVIPVAPARPRAVAPRAGARADGDGV